MNQSAFAAKQPIVAANNLQKNFIAPDGKPFAALDDISLTVASGRLTALVGPDGAGKTTLMRMVAGLLTPDAGKLIVLGEDVAKSAQKVQNRISYMPQKFGLYEDLTVQENLDLYADLHGVPKNERQERFGRMLEMTDMARFTERLAGNLSGGMKQKLGLACTLVRTPDLLLLDEPSVGVDPLSRRDLWKIVQKLIDEEKLSVLVSTAYMDEAERCEDVFVFHEGHLLASGAPDELRKKAHGLTYTVTTPSDMPARDIQAKLYDANDLIVDAVPKGGEVSFIRKADVSEQDVAALLPGLKITPRDEMLEDAFMMLLRSHQDKKSQTSTMQADKLANQSGLNSDNTSNKVIEVENLVRKFGDFTAVDSTSFSVRRGEIFGLLGPNGAGKTTTFRMLCGLLPATSGHLQVAGVNLREARAEARAKIGYVAQKFSLYSNLNVQENLEFFGAAYGLRGKRLRERVKAMLSQFGLTANAPSGILPTGFKQRLAMAAGLIHQPEILFLDEPTSGIDPLARRAFWRTITALSQGGVTIIITTHFMEEAEYCDRILIQDNGKRLAIGTPRQVRQEAGKQGADMNSAFIAIVEQGRASGKSEAPKE